MKIYSVSFSSVVEGAKLVPFNPAPGVELPAIVIGEEGRGRKLGTLPYKGVAPECGILLEAKLSTSRSGRPILVPGHEDTNDVLVVATPEHGFRGSGEVVGRFLGWAITRDVLGKRDPELYPSWNAAYESAKLSDLYWYDIRPIFSEYKPQVIVEGIVADGMAGNMAHANHQIFVCRDGDQFSLYRTGRLYGKEPFVQFVNTGGKLRQVSEWDEFSES